MCVHEATGKRAERRYVSCVLPAVSLLVARLIGRCRVERYHGMCLGFRPFWVGDTQGVETLDIRAMKRFFGEIFQKDRLRIRRRAVTWDAQWQGQVSSNAQAP